MISRRLLLGVSAAWGANWPHFRGPGGAGLSRESGLLSAWPAEGPRLLWKQPGIGDGYGSVAVEGEHLYLVSNHGMEDEFVQALRVRDGEAVWSTRLGNVGNPDQQPPYPMARATPVIDGQWIYVLSSDGDLACVAVKDGGVRWRRSLRKEFGGTPGTWGYSESPLIDGETVVVTPGGAEATLIALKKSTGAEVWRAAVPGGDRAAYASAVVTVANGRRQYVQFVDKGVVGIDAASGRFLWRYTQTAGGPANIAMPIAQGNRVYSTNARRFGGALVELKETDGTVTAQEIYFGRDMPNTLGGQVLVGGVLYGTNSRGPVAADFLTGKIHWQEASFGPGAVIHAEGRLYYHAESGEVALVEATPDAYRELGRFTPPGPPRRRDARERAWAYPALANGRLYIRDLECLWCYAVAK